MQKRRSHNKSRTGCQNCKNRHVKCDEQGPPCAACVARETQDTCTFGSNNGSPSASSTSSISAGFQNLSLASDSRRRLELELMHQWSTSTFESLCSMDMDRKWLQIDVPRWSLKHEFLLHGVFALSAMEIALFSDSALESQPMVYVRAALEYYDTASKAYRLELGNIREGNVQSVYVFSSVAVLINMALMQWEYIKGNALPANMMARVAAMAELFRGSSGIALRHTEALMRGVAGRSIQFVVEEVHRDSKEPIPEILFDAIRRLRTVVKDVNVPDEDTARKETYHLAAEALIMAFVEDFKDVVKGTCIAFPSRAGPGFGVALQAGDPMAMWLMMHWGVLLDRMGRFVWWVRSIGKWIVLDLVERLMVVETEGMGVGEGWRGNVEWARDVVNMSDEERLKF